MKTFIKSLVETITHTDTVRKQTNSIRAEVITASDTITKRVSRVWAEAIPFVDSVYRGLQARFNESVTLADSLFKTTVKVLRETTSIIGTFLTDVAEVVFIDPYCRAINTFSRIVSPFVSRNESDTPKRPPKNC